MKSFRKQNNIRDESKDITTKDEKEAKSNEEHGAADNTIDEDCGKSNEKPKIRDETGKSRKLKRRCHRTMMMRKRRIQHSDLG